MKRLFFALWPDEKTRSNVIAISRALNSSSLSVTAADNIHVTLVFLGNVTHEQEQKIREQIAMLHVMKVHITFDQLTWWRHTGIVCLTARQPSVQMLGLVSKLKDVVKRYGVEVESRPFQAHVTLARKARFKPQLVFPPVHWQADRFVLVESVRNHSGSTYRVLESWALTGT